MTELRSILLIFAVGAFLVSPASAGGSDKGSIPEYRLSVSFNLQENSLKGEA